MPRKIDKWLQKVGSLFGLVRKKEKELVDTWMDMVRAAGLKPADRMMQLMAWDLENNCPDLGEIRKIKKSIALSDAFNDAELALEVKKLAQQFARESIEREVAHAQEVSQYIEQIKQLQDMLIETQRAILELKNPKASRTTKTTKDEDFIPKA